MKEEIFIPITLFLVCGLSLVTWIYFRSKEKQMMIEKGMSYEQMIEFLKSKRNPYNLLKLGIVVLFFGIGLGSGMLLEEYSEFSEPVWISLLIFVGSGLGMITAFFVEYVLTKKQQ